MYFGPTIFTPASFECSTDEAFVGFRDHVPTFGAGDSDLVPTCISRLKRVTIRADQTKIFQTVVRAYTIDMVEVQNKNNISPRHETTNGTTHFKQLFFQEASLKRTSTNRAVADQDLIESVINPFAKGVKMGNV